MDSLKRLYGGISAFGIVAFVYYFIQMRDMNAIKMDDGLYLLLWGVAILFGFLGLRAWFWAFNGEPEDKEETHGKGH